MNRFERAVLLAAGALGLGACSNANPAREEALSHAEPLSAPSTPPPPHARAALAPLALSTGGAPAALAAPVAGPSTATLALADASERATLRGIAMAAAAHAGVSSPTTIHAVAASDHQSAEYALSGAILPDHAPVYVLKMSGGSFTTDHHPQGRPAPRGAFMTVTVDAATHRVTDVGYVDAEPDLAAIGATAVDLSAP